MGPVKGQHHTWLERKWAALCHKLQLFAVEYCVFSSMMRGWEREIFVIILTLSALKSVV